MADVISIGVKVKELRKERNLSQRDLACQAGLSPNAISLIEREDISFSVAPLQRLAVALQVKMSYFFEEEDTHLSVIHVKASEQPALISFVRHVGVPHSSKIGSTESILC